MMTFHALDLRLEPIHTTPSGPVHSSLNLKAGEAYTFEIGPVSITCRLSLVCLPCLGQRGIIGDMSFELYLAS